MDKRLQEWALSFPCSRCAYLGIQKLGTVHVLGKDQSDELQIIAFCYDCARVMMTNRRPRPDRYGPRPARDGDENRIVKLVPRRENQPTPNVADSISTEVPAFQRYISSTREQITTQVTMARQGIDELRMRVIKLGEAVVGFEGIWAEIPPNATKQIPRA
jgi:hypothetical protein